MLAPGRQVRRQNLKWLERNHSGEGLHSVQSFKACLKTHFFTQAGQSMRWRCRYDCTWCAFALVWSGIHRHKYLFLFNSVHISTLTTAWNIFQYLQDLGKNTWACHVNERLRRNCIGDSWLQQKVGHLNRFVSVLKQRLLDQFQQDYHFKRTLWILLSFQTKYPEKYNYRHFAVTLFPWSLNSSPISSVYRRKNRNKIIPRDWLCPLCKDRLSHMFFFRVKHMMISEKVCHGLTGLKIS